MKIFEDTFTQHKEELTQAFIVFNEGSRLNKVLSDEEKKHPDYYKFYKAGQLSKQSEIDKLEKIIKVISDTVDWHIEDCACSHPMSQRELGWSEAMSLIKEKLGDCNAL